MPANRRNEPESEKKEKLVDAARQLFTTKGYEDASMSKIAKLANVAPNTFYWYFKDKDELLIAVLDQLIIEHTQQFLPMLTQPLTDQLIWLVENLQKLSQLVSTVHNRYSKSVVIDAWHNQFHLSLEQILTAQLQLQHPDFDKTGIDSKLKIAAYTIEGLITHQAQHQDIKSICETLVLYFKPSPS